MMDIASAEKGLITAVLLNLVTISLVIVIQTNIAKVGIVRTIPPTRSTTAATHIMITACQLVFYHSDHDVEQKLLDSVRAY